MEPHSASVLVNDMVSTLTDHCGNRIDTVDPPTLAFLLTGCIAVGLSREFSAFGSEPSLRRGGSGGGQQ